MGAAYNDPDDLVETYIEQPGRGCVVRLEYHIERWSAFWMRLKGVDLSPYTRMTYDIRADPDQRIPEKMKIELKRVCHTEDKKFICEETSIKYVFGITDEWQTKTVSLADFGPTGYTAALSSFDSMGELVFVFEADFAGPQGVVYLDNIAFWR